MKDPMVVAFDIRRPWPRVSSASLRANRPRWSIRWSSPFWQVAGRECYFPTLVTVWHVDPSGYDTDERCAISFLRDARGRIVRDDDDNARKAWAWRFHVHHWKVQVAPLQELRRRLLTRCAWCGGRHSKRNGAVNVSHQWDRARGPWWRGEQGLFHVDCSSVEAASRACTCADPGPLERGDSGTCARCGLNRAWRKEQYVIENQREWKTLARGERQSPEMRARTAERAEAGRS